MVVSLNSRLEGNKEEEVLSITHPADTGAGSGAAGRDRGALAHSLILSHSLTLPLSLTLSLSHSLTPPLSLTLSLSHSLTLSLSHSPWDAGGGSSAAGRDRGDAGGGRGRRGRGGDWGFDFRVQVSKVRV